ncbi:hypothetical protein GQ457_16G013660 [Hibiscus cannabinus]
MDSFDNVNAEKEDATLKYKMGRMFPTLIPDTIQTTSHDTDIYHEYVPKSRVPKNSINGFGISKPTNSRGVPEMGYLGILTDPVDKGALVEAISTVVGDKDSVGGETIFEGEDSVGGEIVFGGGGGGGTIFAGLGG